MSPPEFGHPHASSGMPHHVFCVCCGLPNPDHVPGHRPPSLERQTHVRCAACGHVSPSYDHAHCYLCGCNYAEEDEVVFLGVVGSR